jgi:hypothetical protein
MMGGFFYGLISEAGIQIPKGTVIVGLFILYIGKQQVASNTFTNRVFRSH